jgi:hypothetical protein
MEKQYLQGHAKPLPVWQIFPALAPQASPILKLKDHSLLEESSGITELSALWLEHLFDLPSPCS